MSTSSLRRATFMAALGSLCFFSISCARVAQIDRGRLAKSIMRFDPMPRQQAFINETRGIREAAAGGTGQNAGGGCGCN